MGFLKEYWWIILLMLIGMFMNVIKALNRISYKSYLDKKKIKPIPYQDDDDDWPNHKAHH